MLKMLMCLIMVLAVCVIFLPSCKTVTNADGSSSTVVDQETLAQVAGWITDLIEQYANKKDTPNGPSDYKNIVAQINVFEMAVRDLPDKGGYVAKIKEWRSQIK